jgi:hypothetical protein
MHVTTLFPDRYGEYFIRKLAFCVAAEFRARTEQIGMFIVWRFSEEFGQGIPRRTAFD